MKLGLTSVTFRNKNVDEIIELAKKANLDIIEWGSDIHVHQGNFEIAKEVKEKCDKNSLEIFSYGSYYNCLDNNFSPYLETAKILGVSVIRIWAGNKYPYNSNSVDYKQIVKNIRNACTLAQEVGIKIALEYHRNTLTQTHTSTLRLIKNVAHENLYTYWQPNPDISFEEHIKEIRALKEHIICYHVFHWTNGGVRQELHDGKKLWMKYLHEIKDKDINLIMEFVKDDNSQIFLKDAKTLTHLRAKSPKAVFVCEGEKLFEVYPEKLVSEISEHFKLDKEPITKANIKERKESLKKVEYIFSTWGMPHFTEEEIAEYFPKVKAVFYGAGSVKGFAEEFLNKKIKVFSSWGANAVPVAEMTTAQIVLAGKGYFQGIMRYKKQGREESRAFSDAQPCNYNTKIGIIGAGMIGKLVLKALMQYDFEVLVYDPYVSDEIIKKYGAKKVDLETMFSECQIISNHLPNIPSTVGMLNYECFGKMKDNATFINTGRGAQVVEEDLIKALIEKPDMTALLDVTDPEPPVKNSPLNTLENVFLTPHIAGSMNNELVRMGCYMLEEAKNLISGLDTQYEIKLDMLDLIG